jgi:hypothetical protein
MRGDLLAGKVTSGLRRAYARKWRTKMGLGRQDRNAARKLLAAIRVTGTVVTWDHCKDELANDDLDMADLDNVLRCGRIEEDSELHKSGEWRYRVKTLKICVVIQFETQDELSVVTAWRLKGR